MQPRTSLIGRKRRLVVVRAGAASLHPNWLAGPDAPTFDLAISYYIEPPVANPPDTIVSYAPGGKWEGLAAFFIANPWVLETYEWIWLPDDDLDATTPVLNTMFDIAEAHHLELAQPSLTWDSYFTYLITLQNPKFKLRYTNFVELMAPLFSASMLKRILPAFPQRRFGWGLDFLWSRWMAEPAYRTAIIDAVAVRHTRPVAKGTLYGDTFSAPNAEMNEVMLRYNQQSHITAVYAGLDTEGRMLKRGPRLGLTLYRGWHRLVMQLIQTPKPPMNRRKKLFKAMRQIWLGVVDLTPLPPPVQVTKSPSAASVRPSS